MALSYQAEYQLGRRGKMTRTYGGIRALLAIAADVTLALIFGAFGLVFGLVGWTFWLAWCVVRLAALALRELALAVIRFASDLITLPWRVARLRPAPRTNKPAWASFDEL